MIKFLAGGTIMFLLSFFETGYIKKNAPVLEASHSIMAGDTDIIEELEAELMEDAAEETEWKENGVYFRYAIDDRGREKMMILQRKTGAQWKEAARYKIGKNGFRIEDWNKDGLTDIAIMGKRSEQILLFDPYENIFTDIGKFGFEVNNVEGTEDIFYDLFYGAEKGSWGSTLFRKSKSAINKLGYAECNPLRSKESPGKIDVYQWTLTNEKKLKESMSVREAKLKYNDKSNVKDNFKEDEFKEEDFKEEEFLKKYWKSVYPGF